jgi:hypothetical protein
MNIFTLVLDLICVKIVYILSNTIDGRRWIIQVMLIQKQLIGCYKLCYLL